MGGGRYDNLLSMFEGERVAAVGFGMGDVSLANFLTVRDLIPAYTPKTQLYIVVQSHTELQHAFMLAERLRVAGLCVALDFAEKKVSDQLRMAAKHKVPYILIVGEDEANEGRYQLRKVADSTQSVATEAELPTIINNPTHQ